MSTSPSPYRDSQSFNTPPAPPPKPNEASRRSTPQAQSLHSPPPRPLPYQESQPTTARTESSNAGQSQLIQDPGEQWLPKILEDKSKQDLADILAKPELLAALAHSSSTAHPSIAASQEPLQAALTENIALATHLNELEARLTHLRSSTQAQLLSTHQLERQWKQKQSDIDRALAPFSPSSLYQRLSQGVQEQEMVCRALEESFLDGDSGTGPATEREVAEWVRRYRESRKLYYSRQERKQRWDEGRVGGWR